MASPPALRGKGGYIYTRERVRVVSDPFFRRIWDHEPAPREVPHGAGFEAYTQAVEKRLASHHFTRPFQLSKDPRKQDTWTTWVEYLNYVYWSQDKHNRAMKRVEPLYRKAWTKLESLHWPQVAPPATTTTETVDEQLSGLQAKTLAVNTFLRETRAYRRAEAAHRRHEPRAQEVLGQLDRIDAANRPASRGSGPKRKRQGQNDEEPRQQQKQKRTRTRAIHSAPRQETEPNTPPKDADAVLVTEDGPAPAPAPAAAAISQPRRSSRRRINPTAKARPPEPGPGVS